LQLRIGLGTVVAVVAAVAVVVVGVALALVNLVQVEMPLDAMGYERASGRKKEHHDQNRTQLHLAHQVQLQNDHDHNLVSTFREWMEGAFSPTRDHDRC